MVNTRYSHPFIHRDRSRIACKYRQRQPLQTDPSKRIVDDERRCFTAISTIPKPRLKTNPIHPIPILSFRNVDHDLAHKFPCVSMSDDGAEHGALHLCAEAFFELWTVGGLRWEFGCRREGLDEGIVPEVYQVVEVRFGVWAEE